MVKTGIWGATRGPRERAKRPLERTRVPFGYILVPIGNQNEAKIDAGRVYDFLVIVGPPLPSKTELSPERGVKNRTGEFLKFGLSFEPVWTQFRAKLAPFSGSDSIKNLPGIPSGSWTPRKPPREPHGSPQAGWAPPPWIGATGGSLGSSSVSVGVWGCPWDASWPSFLELW